MKKSTFKLAVYGLMMTALLFNCKDKDKSDPTDPDPQSLNAIGAVTVPTVAITAPDAVQSTPGKVEASAATTAVTGDLSNIASSGVVPASVTAAANAVSGALSSSDISAINAFTPGGTVPSDIQAIMAKAMANPALAAYMPKITLPTVNGVTLKGTLRVGGTDDIEKTEKVSVDDACIAKAQAAFDAVKITLDASKAKQDGDVATAYAGWIASIPTNQASCTSTATTNATSGAAAALSDYNASLAALESARAVLGESNYTLLAALYKIAYSIQLSSLTTLEAADKQACIAIATQANTNAVAKRDALLGQINTGYTAAIAEAKRLQGIAAATCHNQGSGQ